jgi:CDP-glycerol glycerophosphotransferase (TagB/SpsB family)
LIGSTISAYLYEKSELKNARLVFYGIAFLIPFIYNIPDIEEYRGFSYEPIEEMMAGDKVKNIEEFKKSLLSIVHKKDKYKKEREKVYNMVNEIPKHKSSEYIFNYIMSIQGEYNENT